MSIPKRQHHQRRRPTTGPTTGTNNYNQIQQHRGRCRRPTNGSWGTERKEVKLESTTKAYHQSPKRQPTTMSYEKIYTTKSSKLVEPESKKTSRTRDENQARNEVPSLNPEPTARIMLHQLLRERPRVYTGQIPQGDPAAVLSEPKRTGMPEKPKEKKKPWFSRVKK